MQKTIFQCDQCEADLGNKAHIHMDTRSNVRIGVAMQNPNDGTWGLHNKIGQTILHFCNGTCVGRYFSALKKKAEGKPEIKKK